MKLFAEKTLFAYILMIAFKSAGADKYCIIKWSSDNCFITYNTLYYSSRHHQIIHVN